MPLHSWAPKRRASCLHTSTLWPLLLALAALPARAEELPTTIQASLVVRILAYDRRMGQHPPPLTLAVLHREGDEGSRQQAQELGAALESAARGRAIAGRPLRVVRIGFRDAPQLQEALSQAQAAALFACEGLEAWSQPIAQVTRRLSVLSLTGSEAQLRQGLAIGLVRQGNSPSILVHLSAARAEGADLDAGLLSLSQLIETPRGAP